MRYIGRPAPRTTVRERDPPLLLHRDDRVCGPAYWAAKEREAGRLVGWFELRPTGREPDEVELGYRLAPEAWGRGYATEGAVALVRRAFDELGMVRVVATTTPVNGRQPGSRRVLDEVGLRLVRIVHEDWPIRSTAPSRGTRSTS